MAIANRRKVTWHPRGLSDARDGTNAFPGAMASLQNLIPAPDTENLWVPRPAATSLTTFPGFTTPGNVNALLVVGNIAYGMLQSGDFAGKDEPFAYNLVTNTFQTITGTATGNLPTSPATTGDWTPPAMAVVGSRIMVTHPGFPGGSGSFFGWLDISGFTDNSHTGNTHSSTLVDTLSSNVLQAGWQVGMTITSSAGDIPAGTTIKAIASNGLSLTLSQPASGTNGGVTLTVAGGLATQPQWASGNTNGNALSAVPAAVANFNGRAYFAVGTGTVLSDSLNGTQVTNASQALNFANGLAVTALSDLPLNSTTQGGQIQSLIAFQGDGGMQQITGDPATNNLNINALGFGVGTLAPNSVTSTPDGLAFISGDGLRILDFYARVGDPIGANGKGVSVPFINAINPSRINAAYNNNVLRISVINGAKVNTPTEEYWLDFTNKVWSGPHTFPAAMISEWQSSTPSQHGFVLAPFGVPGQLFASTVYEFSGSVYTENGTPMSWVYETVLLPDNDEAAMNSVVESTIAFALPAAYPLNYQMLDESGNTLDQGQITGGAGVGGTWGTSTWGAFTWGGQPTTLRQVRVPWKQPLVFKQAQFMANGASIAGFVIGNLYLPHEILGYILP